MLMQHYTWLAHAQGLCTRFTGIGVRGCCTCAHDTRRLYRALHKFLVIKGTDPPTNLSPTVRRRPRHSSGCLSDFKHVLCYNWRRRDRIWQAPDSTSKASFKGTVSPHAVVLPYIIEGNFLSLEPQKSGKQRWTRRILQAPLL